jgi:dCTP deaminase
MILSEKTIRELVSSGRLVIRPLEGAQVQPASVDLRISGEMLRMKGKEIRFEEEQEYDKSEGEEVAIPPKTHVLIRSMEHVELPADVAGMAKLRSSLSRVGLMLNNAGWVDPGFRGTLTLSVFNANDSTLRIKRGTRFAQLVLMKLDRESGGYSGRYSGQKTVTGKL